jgi:hypothetical protein
MKKNTLIAFSVFLILFLLFSCGSDTEDSEINDLLADFEYADSLQKQVVVSEEIINEMIHSIPPPIEMTSLIISSGAKFDRQLLNDPDKINNYESALSKAINLGIYGTELGYLNIYKKTMLSIDYISAVRTLSKDLKVDQFFDFRTLKRLAASSDNVDSLINISTQGFSRMDAYLREQNRTKTSVMIVTGTFVESLFLATQITYKTPNDQLIERIGEQKISLNNMILMLEVYKKDPELNRLISYFKELKIIYNEVEIITTYGDPITKEVNGMLVIEDQSTSEVKMTSETLLKIIKKIKELRTKII